MKRLRHPIRAITEPFGKAGLIVACLALVAAMGGTALAAAKLNGTQKKEVEKIAKKYAGKPGANGTNGSAGAPGAKGDAGAAGAAGGTGSNGTSVTTSSFGGEKKVGSVTCKEGGVAVKSASPETAVCNGAAGSGGGGLLGSGESEKGAWTVQSLEGNSNTVFTAISFPIPLELALGASDVIFLEPGQTEPTHCPGNVADPEAEPGFLCVYANSMTLLPFVSGPIEDPSKSLGEPGAGATGALILLTPETSEPEFGYGTWAVTASS